MPVVVVVTTYNRLLFITSLTGFNCPCYNIRTRLIFYNNNNDLIYIII